MAMSTRSAGGRRPRDGGGGGQGPRGGGHGSDFGDEDLEEDEEDEVDEGEDEGEDSQDEDEDEDEDEEALVALRGFVSASSSSYEYRGPRGGKRKRKSRAGQQKKICKQRVNETMHGLWSGDVQPEP
jgi:hypothetical protein